MESKKLGQQNRQERISLMMELRQKIKMYMKENALSGRGVYDSIGISYVTFRNIMNYKEGDIHLPRLDVLYKVENYLARLND